MKNKSPLLLSSLKTGARILQAPVLAILGAIAIGAVIMLLSGHNPLEAYWAMLKGAFTGRKFSNLTSMLNRATPIIGMGLTAAVAFRAGFINLGGEGQLVLGGLVTAIVALHVPLPGPVLLPVSMLAAMIAGGLYAWLAAFFQARFHAPLLITTLLMNYPAKLFASYMVTHPLRDAASGMSQTFKVPSAVYLPRLVRGTRLHVGMFITLTLVFVIAFIMKRTAIGYEIRMAGLNPRFAEYGGINLKRLSYRVMFASGAIAGLVGAIEVLAIHHRFIDHSLTMPLYAWTGLMAALLSGSNPFGVLIAGLFFSAVQTGGFGMERSAQVPRELSRVLQALIILLVASRSRFEAKKEERET